MMASWRGCQGKQHFLSSCVGEWRGVTKAKQFCQRIATCTLPIVAKEFEFEDASAQRKDTFVAELAPHWGEVS